MKQPEIRRGYVSRGSRFGVLAMLIVLQTVPAIAAVCRNGKPIVPSTPLGDWYCSCFDKAPKGTQVFAVESLGVTVTTPGGAFSYDFSYDTKTACDVDHLILFESQTAGGPHVKRVFPIRETSISRGQGGERRVLPQDQPDLELIRQEFAGHARYVTTI